MKEIRETPAAIKKSIVYSQNSILAVIAAIVLVLLSFYVGTLYQKSHAFPVRQAGIRMSAGGPFGHFSRHMGNIGTVKSVSSSSITLTRPIDGSSKTFSINSSTKVLNNGQTASVSDIKTGDRVLVRTGGNGSTTASQIDINPSFGGPRPGNTSNS